MIHEKVPIRTLKNVKRTYRAKHPVQTQNLSLAFPCINEITITFCHLLLSTVSIILDVYLNKSLTHVYFFFFFLAEK